MKLNLSKLLKLPELKGLSQHRAITEVDSWDGAASNYDDTNAYCAACLIDVNAAAGNTTKKQSHCMLPVKPPGSSSMADKGVMAAAGGRGITAVKKPSDVDQADWDKAVKKAAKTIVSAYEQMEKEAPDSVMEMAGMVERSIDVEKLKTLLLGDTPEGSELRGIISKALEDFKPEELIEEERSIILDNVMQQIYEWSYAESGRPYFTTLYLERDNLYALFNQQGKLFRAPIDVDNDGQTIMVGTLESVIHEFTPISRSGFFTIRQADGQTRFFMIAGTAILNRVGEIDSTKLYDDMIRRAEESDFYPTLDFYHLGEVDNEMFEFGQFDYLGREGVVYVGSGLFYKDHPLAIATERAVQENPDTWGASIEYFRPENRGIEYVQLGGGLEVAAYTEGLNTRISILPESDAACWFTGVTTETREMTDKKLKALRELFGDNEDGFNAFLKKIGNVNREVADKNLIHRQATDEGKDKKSEGTTQADEAQTTDAPTLELDDEVIGVIVKMARSEFESDVLKGITDNLATITVNIATMLEAQQGLIGQVNGMQERLNVLEQDEETKQRTWLNDRSAKSQAVTKVTYRPSAMARSADDKEAPVTSSAKAKAILDNLPKVGI